MIMSKSYSLDFLDSITAKKLAWLSDELNVVVDRYLDNVGLHIPNCINSFLVFGSEYEAINQLEAMYEHKDVD